MAESVVFPGHNREFRAPELTDDNGGGWPRMFGFANAIVTFTCWKPTPDELAEINRSGEIWIAARCGQNPMQPHWVGSLSHIKKVCIDIAGGMWRKLPVPKPIEGTD